MLAHVEVSLSGRIRPIAVNERLPKLGILILHDLAVKGLFEIYTADQGKQHLAWVSELRFAGDLGSSISEGSGAKFLYF